MKLQKLRLRNFTVFDHAEFQFSPGINVLIGENATGKSHVLKAVYCVQKIANSREVRERSRNGDTQKLHLAFDDKLLDVFKPDGNLARLIRRLNSSQRAELIVEHEGGRFGTWIEPDGTGLRFENPRQIFPSRRTCVFVPPRETLSVFPGFLHAYANRELSFDGTYNDLCLALAGNPLKGGRASWAKEILDALEKQLDGNVELRGELFYVGAFEAQLVAEGLRKVASLVQLIRNGSIGEDGLLIWDEPEAGLNPRLVKVVAETLLLLAAKGVQVLIATHDYLLTSELSLHAEYETLAGKAAKSRFFSLSRENLQSPVTVETADKIPELEHNAILEAFSAHYNREQRLFYPDAVSSRP